MINPIKTGERLRVHHQVKGDDQVKAENDNLFAGDSHSTVIVRASIAREWLGLNNPYPEGSDNYQLWQECCFGKESDLKSSNSITAQKAALLFETRAVAGGQSEAQTNQRGPHGKPLPRQ